MNPSPTHALPTFQQAITWTDSCNASVQEAEVSLKTWLAQGTGHVLLYSGECDATEEGIVADHLGDVSSAREQLASTSSNFADGSVSTVTALASFAVERSTYDASYVANNTEVVHVDAYGLIENVTSLFPITVDDKFAGIYALADTLVSCVSPRGDDDGSSVSSCPLDRVRDLLDEARADLDAQLAYAQTGFEEYAAVYEEYASNAEAAHDNMIAFYDGVVDFIEGKQLSIAGAGDWASLSVSDFFIPALMVPSSSGILTGIDYVSTAGDIWADVDDAYVIFSQGAADIGDAILAEVENLTESWDSTAAALLANITITFSLADYDPPLYGNSSAEADSNARLESDSSAFSAIAASYSADALALVDTLGPAAANQSFPTSPSLNSTFTFGSSSTVISPSIDYTFAAFASKNPDFGSWTVSLAHLGVLLLAADYIFRCGSSIRLFIQFWGRGGLALPDADLRVDRRVAGVGGLVGSIRNAAARVLLNPFTGVLFFSSILVLLTYNVALLYLPIFDDYRAGCVDQTQEGSFFTQNAYSIAYNYASDGGNRDTWSFQVFSQ